MRSLVIYYLLLAIAGALLAVGLCTMMGILAGKIPLNNGSFFFLVMVFAFFELAAWAQHEYRKSIEHNGGGGLCVK